MDGFRILMEAAKKKRKSIDTTKAKHPKIGFPGYAFGSNPGDRPNETASFQPTLGDGPALPAPTTMHDGGYCGVVAMGGGGGGGSVAPVVALTGGNGGGDGGAGGATESVESTQINAIIESYKQANPSNDTIGEIQKMFESAKNGFGMLYHSCDGTSALDMVPATDEQISALAATCEASLTAFKNYTGHDYINWRKAH